MKRVRPLLLGAAALALAVLAGGCWLTSAQVFVNYSLPNPFTIASADGFERIDVDLNEESDYTDHKDKLKGLADVAVLGSFTNVSGGSGKVQIYITPGTTDFESILDIQHNSTLLWQGSIGAEGSTKVVTWAESVKQFNAAGKAILVHEVKGDGAFTLYAIGTPGTFTIRVNKGLVALILNGGV